MNSLVPISFFIPSLHEMATSKEPEGRRPINNILDLPNEIISLIVQNVSLGPSSRNVYTRGLMMLFRYLITIFPSCAVSPGPFENVLPLSCIESSNIPLGQVSPGLKVYKKTFLRAIWRRWQQANTITLAISKKSYSTQQMQESREKDHVGNSATSTPVGSFFKPSC